MDPSIEAETAARGSAPATGQPRAPHLTVTVGPGPAGARLLVPTGIETPHDRIANVSLEGGVIEDHATAAGLALGALRVRATADEIVVRYEVRAPERAAYPESAFAPRQSRHTTAAQDLARASSTIAADAGGGEDGIAALVEEARSRFDYGHPETRFNDGADAVPHLACGRTEGSCVDINTYLVASLRAAGYEAAYLYGYFFPAERGGVTNDMHCWVVTRHGGRILEWDIAHHMKAGLSPVRPALDPRPGHRVALGHSMGHRYAFSGDASEIEMKLLAEPVWLVDGTGMKAAPLTAQWVPKAPGAGAAAFIAGTGAREQSAA